MIEPQVNELMTRVQASPTNFEYATGDIYLRGMDTRGVQLLYFVLPDEPDWIVETDTTRALRNELRQRGMHIITDGPGGISNLAGGRVTGWVIGGTVQ